MVQIQMKDQMIAEQIDLIIMGVKAYDLIQLIFDTSLQTTAPKNSQSYLKKLQTVLSKDIKLKDNQKVLEKSKGITNIRKFTKSLMTQSFWLQFHFFVHGPHIYDPLLSSIAGGNISICIMVNDQTPMNTNELKNLITKSNSPVILKDYEKISSQKNNGRDEIMMETKILDTLHSIKINDFSSILSLKIVDGKRIIEQSSNLRLSVNQILRWVADRHFENQYRIRLRSDLGDEIENLSEIKEQSYCNVM